MTYFMDLTCRMDEYWRRLPLPKVVLGGTLPCPLAFDYCCVDPLFEKIGEIESYSSVYWEGKLAVHYTPSRIILQYGRRDVECIVEGEPTIVCKYFLKSTYCYTVKSEIKVGIEYTSSRTLTEISACVEKNTAREYSETWGEPLDCEADISGSIINPSGLCTQIQEVCFERIKFFDTPPTGSQTFSNADTGGNCQFTTGTCSNIDFYTEVCIATPEEIPQFRACYCPPIVVNDTNIYTDTNACSPHTYQIYDPDSCTPPGDCIIDAGICFGTNTRDCSATFTQNCKTRNEEAEEECEYDPDSPCGVEGGGGFGGVLEPPTGSTPDGNVFLCSCYQGAFLSNFSPSYACTSEDCDATCCYQPFECENCPPCFNKLSPAITVGDHAQMDYTVDCSEYEQDGVCISAPTWGVSLS